MDRLPHGVLNLNKSYNFVDKVPVIDELRNLVDGHHEKDLARITGVGRTTIHNLFSGKTVGPRRTTLEALARPFGKRLGLVDL